MRRKTLQLILSTATALALAACGGEEAEPAYEAGATDEGGGELIVTDPAETGVAVDLPETPMTPVPPEDSPSPAETVSPAAAE
jgi:hypothetical protein